MTLACLGSLLGWQFTVPNILKAMADEGFIPKVFSDTNSMGAPVKGMLILGVVQTLLGLSAISPSLNEQFEVLVNLATITNLVPYILCMSAVKIIMVCAGKGDELGMPMICLLYTSRGHCELVRLSEAEGRVALEGALPYPPGILTMQPGERWSESNIKYFSALEEGINVLPGFAPEIQGVYFNKVEDGSVRAFAYLSLIHI